MMSLPYIASPISILILDPDEQACAESIQAFTARGWSVDYARTFIDALELVPKHTYNVALIEVKLPDILGTEAWSYIHKLSPQTAGIITTRSRSLHQSINPGVRGVISFLLKPFDLNLVCDLIVTASEGQRLEQENARVEKQLARLGDCLSRISRAPANQVISTALAQIPSVWKADWDVIYCLNADKSWTPHWTNHESAASKRDWHPAKLERLEPWMFQAVESGQPVVLGMPGSLDSEHPVPGSREYNLGSLVIVPLSGGEENYGVLLVVTRANSEQNLTTREVEFIKAVGQTIADALERAGVERQLTEQSFVDPATASYTSAFLEHVLELEYARRKRYNRPFALVLLNLDPVEEYYQTCGEKLDRQLLRATMQLVQQELRRADVIAHLVGWQFAILLPETDSASAQQVAHRLADRLHARLFGNLPEPWPEIKVQVMTPSEETMQVSGLLEQLTTQQSEWDG